MLLIVQSYHCQSTSDSLKRRAALSKKWVKYSLRQHIGGKFLRWQILCHLVGWKISEI